MDISEIPKPVSVIEKDGSVYCMVEELNLASKGASISEALIKLNEEFKKLKKSEDIFSYNECEPLNDRRNDFFSFIFRTVIACGFIFFTLVLGGVVGGISLGVGYNLVSERVDSKIKESAPKNEEEKLERFRDGLQTFKPYWLEIKKVLNEE